ncbi:MAG: esterase, partial [Prolixibacteraceae bacterium]|nr:esterase [Prolixibacteraceae bacterium]
MRNLFIVLLFLAIGIVGFAQVNDFPAATKPASTNILGADYPRVDSLGRVYFRLSAPDATSVSVSLGNVQLIKGDDGFWTGVTQPQDPGFHY